MTRDEARLILQAYHPDGRDAGDAAFCEALKLAETDPELARWFEAEQAFDRVMMAKLGEARVPAELHAAILAGVSPAEAHPHRVWVRPAWMAAAAAVVLVLGAMALFRPSRAAADTEIVAFVTDDARHPETHRGGGPAAAALQASLVRPAMRLGDSLPADLAALHATGCHAITFHGHELLEVCFQRNGAWFHCYVGRPADFPSLAGQVRPSIQTRDKLAVATWADAAHVYLLVSDTGEGALRGLL